MIYTVTLNPSLDYMVSLDGFSIGKVNRTAAEHMFPGGKGINVSVVLHNLGIASTALGFVAGFSGEEIDRMLSEMGIRTDFIRVRDGFSRINVKLQDYDGTEINGLGPDIDTDAVQTLCRKLDMLVAGDTLVLAGSIPKGVPDSVYGDFMASLQNRGVRFVVDATGERLMQALKYRPFLIKPNHHELGNLFSVSLDTRESVIPYARRLKEMGAVNVLVSLAENGAVLIDEFGDVHMVHAPEGTLVNAVGAGDSMVAGFLAGWSERLDYDYAFRMGVSAGSASAFSEGLATRAEVERVFAVSDTGFRGPYE